MNARAHLAVVASIVFVAACSGGDPGGLTLGGGQWAGPGSSSSADSGATSSGNDDGGTAGQDAGSGGGSTSDAGAGADAGGGGGADGGSGDGGASQDAAPANAFTGAGAYASAPPATQAQSHHGFTLAGKNCFDCHAAGGSAGIPFTIAGRVFADSAGQTPAADVQVRVVDHNGVASTAHSDTSGYFWVKGGVLALPALAGARKQSTALMVGSLTDPAKAGGCNGCHNGTTTAYMHVP